MKQWNVSIPKPYWQSRLRDATSLPKVISFFLAAEIVRRRLGRDTRFPQDEQELADQLKTSRQTINQAWEILERDGIVQVRQGRGVTILEPTYLEPDSFTLRALYGIRKQAEKVLARLAAQRRSPEDLEILKSTLRKQDALLRQALKIPRAGKKVRDSGIASIALDYFAADVDFHAAVRSAAGDTWLEIIDEIAEGKTCLERVQTLERLEYIPLITRQHWDIYTAILKEDSEKADQCVEEHLETAFRAAQGRRLPPPIKSSPLSPDSVCQKRKKSGRSRRGLSREVG